MLVKRVCVGLGVAAFFAAMFCIAFGPVLFALILALSTICQLEFYELAKKAGYRVYKTLGIACGTIWLSCEYLCLPPFQLAQPIASAFPVWSTVVLFSVFFAILLRTMFDSGGEKAFESAAITILGFFYLPVVLSYFIRLAQWDATTRYATTRASVFLVFFMSIVVKMSDTGAFAAGTAFARTRGTHPLFPRISPKKSWEGLVGGIVTGALTGMAVAFLAGRFRWGPDGIFWTTGASVPAITVSAAAVVSSALVVVGVFGDLIESMFKRAAATKDSASIFPCIGGLLDVIDSLVFAPAVFYFFLQVFLIK